MRGPLIRPASHSSAVLPFMERLVGFGCEAAADDVLDGFITGKAYVVDNELLPADSKNNGNKLASVRVADQFNLPVRL